MLFLPTRMLAAALFLAGCASPAGVIFQPLAAPLVWPDDGDPPRVRYVGQLSTSADLKPPVRFTERVGQALFGRAPIHSMLTPYAVCTDGGDRLFVADSNAQTVHVFDLKTRQYEQWRPDGRGANGIALRFSQPVGLAWDAGGRLYVADSVAGSIFVFDTNGRFRGEIAADVLQRPAGLAYDVANGRLFVADVIAHQVVVLAPDGSVVTRIGQRGSAAGTFNFPTNVALDRQGRLYVSDSLNFRIQQFAPDLSGVRIIGSKGDLPGYFSQPKGLATDSENHLYVIDANFEAVQIFNADGDLLLDFGQEGRGPGEFWLPAGIYIDPHDRIWIGDAYNRRVQVFDYVPEVGRSNDQ